MFGSYAFGDLAYGSLPEPIEAQVSISRVIGSVNVSTTDSSEEASLAISRIIGTVSVVAGRPVGATIGLSPIIGKIKVEVDKFSDWSLAGFPLPLVSGYQYAANDSLVRTQMASGEYRQRRRWRDGYRKAQVTFEIDRALIASFETFLDAQGAGWFTMPMVTGDNSSAVAVSHPVRLTGNISVGSLYGDIVQVTLPLEIRESQLAIVAPPGPAPCYQQASNPTYEVFLVADTNGTGVAITDPVPYLIDRTVNGSQTRVYAALKVNGAVVTPFDHPEGVDATLRMIVHTQSSDQTELYFGYYPFGYTTVDGQSFQLFHDFEFSTSPTIPAGFSISVCIGTLDYPGQSHFTWVFP